MISIGQILILVLYSGIRSISRYTFKIGIETPIFAGFFTGLVCGNVESGILIGATLQLLSLGVATYGSIVIPDMVVGAIVATVFSLKMEPTLALTTIALPISIIMQNVGVLAQYSVEILQNFYMKAVSERAYKKSEIIAVFGALPVVIAHMVPVLVLLLLGDTISTAFIASLPTWLLNGLNAAGGTLPIVGIVVLMRYLPTKKLWHFMLLGFLLTVYLKLPIIALALLGVIIAYVDWQRHKTERGIGPLPTLTSEGGEIDE